MDVLAAHFFVERVINIWNGLPATVNFSSLSSFKSSIGHKANGNGKANNGKASTDLWFRGMDIEKAGRGTLGEN